MSEQTQPDRGSGTTPTPQQPTPPTGGEEMQDHAPPRDVPSGELLGDGGAARSPEKDVDDWATGDEPMTGPQRSYLETLAREADVAVSADLTKAEASRLIDKLQQRTGRGQGGG